MNEGSRHVAQRMVNAADCFVSMLIEMHGITKIEAYKVLTEYRKAKVVKLDAVGGRYNIKHGVFLDRDVIQNAINA